MGLAMFCGVAVSAQASSTTITSTTSPYPYPTDFGDKVTLPSGSASFVVLGAAAGTSETATFTYLLTTGKNFNYAVGFFNAETSDDSIDSATLKYKALNDTKWTEIWNVSSKDGYGQIRHPDLAFGGYIVDLGFSGWTYANLDMSTLASGEYQFQLTLDNQGAGNVKADSLAFFAPTPEPSSYIPVVLFGTLSFVGFLHKNRTLISKS